jgi:hypothetical protein
MRATGQDGEGGDAQRRPQETHLRLAEPPRGMGCDIRGMTASRLCKWQSGNDIAWR